MQCRESSWDLWREARPHCSRLCWREEDDDSFVIDALGFGGESREEFGEGESFCRATVDGKATLDGVIDGGSIGGNKKDEATGEDVESVTERVAKFKEVRV
ncbi:hypothetical protein VNO78_15947 [Psophocarpus tetragonolobus]|uniref:Uncharacterized protein n=1 Tax=Psophocarpus tetragonolobus TaxID=3891 RepID=A0AAN9SFU7_PSOTE